MTRKEIVTGEIRKNARETYTVALRDIRGNYGVDIRVFAFNGVASVATPKGVVIRPDALRPIIDALEKAEDAAKREGLI